MFRFVFWFFASAFLISANAQKARTNIVLFVADDHLYTDCGAYGSREVPTLNLHPLASEGLLFRHAFAGSHTCMPSRAVLYRAMTAVLHR